MTVCRLTKRGMLANGDGYAEITIGEMTTDYDHIPCIIIDRVNDKQTELILPQCKTFERTNSDIEYLLNTCTTLDSFMNEYRRINNLDFENVPGINVESEYVA